MTDFMFQCGYKYAHFQITISVKKNDFAMTTVMVDGNNK